MARLCVRVAANDHPTNPALTPLRTRPGDVVELAEDGHAWRPGELDSGRYRFVDVTDATAAQLVHLTAPRYDAGGKMTRKRNQCFDVVLINSGGWAGATTVTLAQVNAVTITRA